MHVIRTEAVNCSVAQDVHTPLFGFYSKICVRSPVTHLVNECSTRVVRGSDLVGQT